MLNKFLIPVVISIGLFFVLIWRFNPIFISSEQFKNRLEKYQDDTEGSVRDLAEESNSNSDLKKIKDIHEPIYLLTKWIFSLNTINFTQ